VIVQFPTIKARIQTHLNYLRPKRDYKLVYRSSLSGGEATLYCAIVVIVSTHAI
jgi:hypothetical protein